MTGLPTHSLRAGACLLGLFLFSAATTRPALAAEPRFNDIVVSSDKDSKKNESVLKPDTAKIFLKAELADVPLNAKMSCIWVAAQTLGAPANYVIDTADMTAGSILGVPENVLNCSLSKPTSGWPEGSYRVDLTVDGKKTNEARFEIKSEAIPTAAAPAAAAPAAAVPAVAARQARQDFTIVNKTGYDIREVYVSPGKADNWEDDVLGDDELDDGDEQLIRFKRAEKTCIWDLKVVYSEDDSEAIWYDIDLCKITKMTIRYSRKTDKTSATFD